MLLWKIPIFYNLQCFINQVMNMFTDFHHHINSVSFLCSYNLESGIWNTVPINSGPVPRYGHSLAAYQVNMRLSFDLSGYRKT